MTQVRLSHVGVLVSDIERSSAFYAEALGFEPLTGPINLSAEFQNLSKSEKGAGYYVRFFGKDDFVLQLLCDEALGQIGAPKRDRAGLWHLCVTTDDLDALIARVEAHGGKAKLHTRTTLELEGGETFEAIFIADPDGQPIEVTTASRAVARQFENLLGAKQKAPG